MGPGMQTPGSAPMGTDAGEDKSGGGIPQGTAAADEETEEQLEDRLRNEAKELDIDVVALLESLHPAKEPQSAQTTSSVEIRRSASIDSRASQSTGFVSNLSEISREQNNGRRMSRYSLSFRDRDFFSSRTRQDHRHSMSFSPPSTPSRSTFSLPLTSPSTSPKRSFRHLRGLSILKMRRTDSTISIGRTQGSASARSHDQPSSNGVVERYTSKSEPEGSQGLSQPGHAGGCVARECLTLPATAPEAEQQSSLTGGISGEARRSELDHEGPILRGTEQDYNETPLLADFRKEHIQLHEQLVARIEAQRLHLEETHRRLREEMKARQESTVKELLERHADAISEAEDKQVKAESDMRRAHEQEKRDNATALKHMEAYCAGTYSNGEKHGRTVTEQDLAELEKTRGARTNMDLKHESAINVLRGEQSRRMKLRAQRQEKEVQVLQRQQRRDQLEFEEACTAEAAAQEVVVAQEKYGLDVRCKLELAITRKKLEKGRLASDVPQRAGNKCSSDVQLGAPCEDSSTLKASIRSAMAVSGLA